MYIPSFHLNSIAITGILSSKQGNEEAGHALIHVAEGQDIWVYFDYPSTWQQIVSIDDGAFVTIECGIQASQGEGGNDILIAQRLNPTRPMTTIAGSVSNVQPPKVVGDKKVMEFSLRQTGKTPEGEKTTSFYQCELWDDKLFKKVVKGQFACVKGALKVQYFTDKNGNARCKTTIAVNHLATPFAGATQTPSAPPTASPMPSGAPPLVGAVSNGKSTVPTDVDDEF